MLDQVIEMVENMSEEEIQTLMETEFPEELEKQASAELAKNDLFEGLYAYGANMATLELEAEESLDKTAAEQAESDDAELSQFIEEQVMESGILDVEDEVALHKTAQVAAAYLFAGYADALEKEAKATAAQAQKIRKNVAMSAAARKSSGYSEGGRLQRMAKFLKKHKGKAAAGAGLAALTGGAVLAKRHMDKQASEMSAIELTAEISYNQDMIKMIGGDLEKCASKGAEIGKKVKGAFKDAVDFAKSKAKAGHEFAKKNPGKAAGIGAGVALGGFGAHKLLKKKEKED